MNTTYDRLSLYRPILASRKYGSGGSLGGGKYGRQLTKEAESIDESIAALDRLIAGGAQSAAALSRMRQQRASLVEARARRQKRMAMFGVKGASAALKAGATGGGAKQHRTGEIQTSDNDERAGERVDVPQPLPVPLPAERVRPVDVTYASREGQAEFRAAILAAYGRCAVTGCQVEAVLQAAHIIPYVDARSNLISNGLCLRSDIHCLYDRNLIRIAGDGGIVVDEAVGCPEYRALHGRQIVTPEAQAHKPNPVLMSVRHEYIAAQERRKP